MSSNAKTTLIESVPKITDTESQKEIIDAGKTKVALISQQKKANMSRKRNRVSGVTDPIQVFSSLREQKFADSERPEKRPRRKININLKDSRGETALSKAISRGNLKIILKLLENGADPNIKVKGIPALLYSYYMWSIKGRTTFIRACLKAGADPDVRSSDGKTLLMIACEENYSTIVDELLKINADQHLQDKNGKSVLMYAVENGDEKIVQLLLTETEK